MMKLSPLDIQHQEFSKQAFGYNRQQVRDYLEHISQAFASQLAEINHLQQELLKQAEEIESLKLREDALEKDRHLFEDYRFTEVEHAEKELENLRQRAQQDIELQRQEFATELAKQKAQARREIRELREGNLHILREERDNLARDISLLRQLRSKSVRHMQLLQQQSQLLLAFVEDTSQGLEPPPELLQYLDKTTLSQTTPLLKEESTLPENSEPLESEVLPPAINELSNSVGKHNHAKNSPAKLNQLSNVESFAKLSSHIAKELNISNDIKDIMKDRAKDISSESASSSAVKVGLESQNSKPSQPDKRYKSLYSALKVKKAPRPQGIPKNTSITHKPLDDGEGIIIDISDEISSSSIL